MRRAVIVLAVLAIAGSLVLGLAPAAEAGRMTVTPSESGHHGTVDIWGRTGCTSNVLVRARTVGPTTAINPQTLSVSSSTFQKRDVVVRLAASNKVHNIDAKCTGTGGHIATDTLKVLPYTGLPVLPQLLLGFGLVGTGVFLLSRDRRPRRNPA